MLVKDALAAAYAKLDNLPSPRLDAEVLLAYLLGWSRTKLLSELYVELTNQQINDFQMLIGKRAQNIPVAYLTGVKEFMGLKFYTDEHVLIPRPETERLVAVAKKMIEDKRLTKVYDVGTGSGNIAVTLAVHLPQLQITASDISEGALAVARQNANAHGVESRVTFVRAHLSEHIQDAQLIVANLPYIPNRFEVMEDILHEPAVAIFGGEDGLELYREMFSQPAFQTFTGICLIEFGARQYQDMQNWLEHKFSRLTISPLTNLDGSVTGMMLDFTDRAPAG